MPDLVAPNSVPVASPFRWAGGKRWLRPFLDRLIENVEIGSYHEPFLGGASVFLGLRPFAKSYLRDANRELVEAFGVIRDRPSAVAELVDTFSNDADTYYAVRASVPSDKLGRAARFLFLNHTSYNGIYRVNLNGVYNVPFGARKANFPTVDQLCGVSHRLKSAHLEVGDFAGALARVEKRDLVFLDPPYTVAHNHNGFVKYNQKLFSFDDQKRLRSLVDEIKERKAYYILTNAAHESIRALFSNGDHLIETNRRNSIGGVNAARGSATEYLFTNLELPDR